MKWVCLYLLIEVFTIFYILRTVIKTNFNFSLLDVINLIVFAPFIFFILIGVKLQCLFNEWDKIIVFGNEEGKR